jgi:putative SOS response-associated peptidase YedK
MCGRYGSPDDAAIEREFNLVRAVQFPASYNAAPTDDVSVVRVNKEGERTGSRMQLCGIHPNVVTVRGSSTPTPTWSRRR